MRKEEREREAEGSGGTRGVGVETAVGPLSSLTPPAPPSSRAKAAILDTDFPALQKLLAKRGIIKALPPDQLAARHAQLGAARTLVAGVPDGVHVAAGGPTLAGRSGLLGGKGGKGGKAGEAQAISLVASAGRGGAGPSSSGRPGPARVDAEGYWDQSGAATAFRAEYEASKKRQDGVLDGIEKGLGELKEIGTAMGRALDEQYVLTAAIDDKVKRSRTSESVWARASRSSVCAPGERGGTKLSACSRPPYPSHPSPISLPSGRRRHQKYQAVQHPRQIPADRHAAGPQLLHRCDPPVHPPRDRPVHLQCGHAAEGPGGGGGGGVKSGSGGEG